MHTDSPHPGSCVRRFPDQGLHHSATTCLIPQRVTYREFTGRANLDWTPTLPFTDKSLFYASYSRGYKGGGFNTPCQASLGQVGGSAQACGYPLSYNPEFIDAYEVGTKNTLGWRPPDLGWRRLLLQLQWVSDFHDRLRVSVNLNINAKIWGARV